MENALGYGQAWNIFWHCQVTTEYYKDVENRDSEPADQYVSGTKWVVTSSSK